MGSYIINVLYFENLDSKIIFFLKLSYNNYFKIYPCCVKSVLGLYNSLFLLTSR